MAEYIEREALLAEYDRLHTGEPGRARKLIAEAPAADVVEVRHGRWVEYDRFICNSNGEPIAKIGTIFICSKCGREENYKEPYCHCGARMDGE